MFTLPLIKVYTPPWFHGCSPRSIVLHSCRADVIVYNNSNRQLWCCREESLPTRNKRIPFAQSISSCQNCRPREEGWWEEDLRALSDLPFNHQKLVLRLSLKSRCHRNRSFLLDPKVVLFAIAHCTLMSPCRCITDKIGGKQLRKGTQWPYP